MYGVLFMKMGTPIWLTIYQKYGTLGMPDYTSHKKSSERKQVHVGMEASKTNQTKMGMTPQHFHTIPTSCAICHHLHKYALCFFVVGWVVVVVQCVLMCMESELCCGLLQCSCMADTVCLDYIQKLCSA